MKDYLSEEDREALREMRQLEGECRHLLKFIPDATAYSGHRYQHHVLAMLRTVEQLRARYGTGNLALW